MLDTDWSDSWRDAFRIELRAEAIGLASRGWPVLPGTYPPTTQSGAVWAGPAPAHADWRERLGAHPHQVAEWWTGQPFSLLVATGLVLDAVEVDADVGRRAARLLRQNGQPAPIVATPNRRWLFLTGLAGEVAPALSEHHMVTCHGLGAWIPLPPTPFEHGVVHWRVKPDAWGWHLPAAETVHQVLVRALDEHRASQAHPPAMLAA